MTKEEISRASVKDILMEYAHIGDKFWTTCYGYVKLKEIKKQISIELLALEFGTGYVIDLDENGKLCKGAECVLFPDKGSTWTDYAIEEEEKRRTESEYGLVVGKYYKYNGTIFKCVRIVENETEDDEYVLQNVISDFVISLQERDVVLGTVNIEPIDEFDISFLKPYDKTLIRYGSGRWHNTFYGFFLEDDGIYHCSASGWTECIPYNFETANLLGTLEDCPKFYNTKRVKE